MTKTIEIATEEYNARRYGKPWIARVKFDRLGKTAYDWGSWIGDVGYAGVLIIDAIDGDIIARGQKDHRGNHTIQLYYQVCNGALVQLTDKKAAYDAAKDATKIEE